VTASVRVGAAADLHMRPRHARPVPARVHWSGQAGRCRVVGKGTAEEAIPNLVEWKQRWTEPPLGREVAPAVFGGDGPSDTLDSGPSSRDRESFARK
jgi:hypothetical protein